MRKKVPIAATAVLIMMVLLPANAGAQAPVVNCTAQALGAGSLANGISDNAIAGLKMYPKIGYSATDWLDSNNRPIDVGSLLPAGSKGSRAFAVNSSKWVVGTYEDSSSQSCGFLCIGGSKPVMIPLPDEFNMVYGINNAGVLFGFRHSETGHLAAVRLDWPNGLLAYLDLLPGAENSVANYGNVKGQTVGYQQDSAGITHAVIWNEDGIPRDIHRAGAAWSNALCINESGQVVIVGGFPVNGGEITRSFIWKNGSAREIIPPVKGYCSASAINDDGWVCGSYRKADNTHQAFVWREGVRYDLRATGWTRLEEAYWISPNGRVCGTGMTSKGISSAYVAIGL